MAETLPQTMTRQFAGLAQLPAHRQFGMVVGLAVVVALAVSIALWGARPAYQVLLPGLAERDASMAITVLDRHNIGYRLDNASGALMVPANRVAEARLQLATEGLPRSDGVGFELLDQDTGLGTSRMIETVRYQRALEGELARSVRTLNGVESARVHLALPRQSVFMRDRTRAGASVLVNLHPGRQLGDSQLAGIIHLVASSVPELDADDVTVVDQRGRLLSQDGSAGASLAGAPGRQLEYTGQVEAAVRQRVEDILMPLLGRDGMRVQVTADIDFNQVESTRETFDPETRALRSEQRNVEETRGAVAGGVPGALTNQPPGAAAVRAQGAGVLEEDTLELPGTRSERSTRNFEVDRTISHIREAPGALKRLSVAVVVDHQSLVGEDGVRTRAPRDEAEMAYLDGLVREAVGFREARGDRVNVVNASFREIEPEAALAEAPIWEEAWFRDLMRQIAAGLGLLLLVLMVLRPALKSLARVEQKSAASSGAAMLAAASAAALPSPEGDGGQALLARGPEQHSTPAVRTTETEMARARQLAAEDPRLVAQVVRQWMAIDEK